MRDPDPDQAGAADADEDEREFIRDLLAETWPPGRRDPRWNDDEWGDPLDVIY